MRLGTYWGTAHINSALTMSGKLYITQERIDVSTRGPKADPNWTAVDSAGHFHAMSGKEYPTLHSRSIPVPCDGSCGGVCGGEGTSRTEWTCRLCAEVVEPGLIPGPHYDSIPGRYDWRIELDGFATGSFMPGHGEVSVRFDAAGPEPRTFFGMAAVGDSEMSSTFSGPPHLKMTLYAANELGDRPLVKELTK
jgi:hypothetical protein